jgi:hypothetical protein
VIPTPATAADGIHFFRTIRISCSYLNEDSGWYEGSGDEIYVQAKSRAPSETTSGTPVR